MVLTGILLGQTLVYGPSLIGKKVLLPLDVLQQANVYLPRGNATAELLPQNPVLSDLVYFEPIRQFCASEFASGRTPLWNPYQLGGMTCTIGQFAPFAFQYWFQTPVVIAFTQLLAALVAGVGMYAFCRRVLGVCFWPAALMGWIYPLTGFFIFWQVYATSKPICWLPWLLLCLHSCLCCGSLLAVGGIAIVSCFAIGSGNPDMGGQVLLIGAIFGIWCLIQNWNKLLLRARIVHSVAAILAVVLGIMMAADFLLPYLEHAESGQRMGKRIQGAEERPPRGTYDAPQIIIPDIYGTMRTDSYRTVPYNQMESSAAAYSGFFSVLLLAPLAFCSKLHRSITWLLAFLALFALSWSLNLPGFVEVLRLPGLNMMSHNRLVFAANFAFLALAAIGLSAILSKQVSWSKWFRLPVCLMAAIGLWCLFRLAVLPSEVAMLDDQKVQTNFRITYLSGVVLATLGLAGWWLVRYWRPHPALSLPVIGTLLLADLGWFAHDRAVQCSAELYFPPIPALQQVAQAPWGRVVGSDCLPPSLGTSVGLHDARGYDGVDPAMYVELLMLAASPRTKRLSYAATQWLIPETALEGSSGIRVHPVLNLLGVRYVIFRGSPPEGFQPRFQSPDYWVVENLSALPRAFIPESVETIVDPKERLNKLGSRDFDPNKVAYAETDLGLPQNCVGRSAVVHAVPTRVTVQTEMETAGLLVLNDRWDPGWRAYVNEIPKPLEIANHALRGVVLAPGKSIVEFRYEPATLALGRTLSNGAAAIVAIWFVGVIVWERRKQSGPRQKIDSTPDLETVRT